MNDDKKHTDIHVTNNFYAPIGQHIEHVDTVNFRMDGDGTFHFGQVGHVEQTKTDATDGQDVVAERLTPIFYGNKEEARGFLASIRGMKPTQITERVNQLVGAGKISELSRKRDLWTVLHDAGIYTCTEANWNDQIR